MDKCEICDSGAWVCSWNIRVCAQCGSVYREGKIEHISFDAVKKYRDRIPWENKYEPYELDY